eukprot:gnl/MRDRNA2_/MRDRNA2_32515_c0_seq1.p1 gnl/MRDRNA2_/MRDRNA2_32515_c0~~gnl/MRDRNA2_/MRDRNA2_32515_c0_seq1.p1  ORF type:complete len:157 (-),score=26.68 gnl/MRDRNA2_/MRDRNA2_32515_c0_seq1:24-494(-)
MAGFLTVRSLRGKDACLELTEGQSVYELRQQLALTLGLVQVQKGLSYNGKILTSNSAVTDLLGLTVDEVVFPPAAFRGPKASRMLNVWDLDEEVLLCAVDTCKEWHPACSQRQDNESGMHDDDKNRTDLRLWELDAIVCLEMEEGQGYVLFYKDTF